MVPPVGANRRDVGPEGRHRLQRAGLSFAELYSIAGMAVGYRPYAGPVATRNIVGTGSSIIERHRDLVSIDPIDPKIQRLTCNGLSLCVGERDGLRQGQWRGPFGR
jgi:hypothetical protein